MVDYNYLIFEGFINKKYIEEFDKIIHNKDGFKSSKISFFKKYGESHENQIDIIKIIVKFDKKSGNIFILSATKEYDNEIKDFISITPLFMDNIIRAESIYEPSDYIIYYLNNGNIIEEYKNITDEIYEKFYSVFNMYYNENYKRRIY